MKFMKKILRRYDRRQQMYNDAMADTVHESKVKQRMQTNGLRRPGSRNQKKVLGG